MLLARFCRPLANVEGRPAPYRGCRWPLLKIRREMVEHFDRAQLRRRRVLCDVSVDEALGALAEIVTRVVRPVIWAA
jgi:hypothetical protein